jgi:glutaminase
VTTDLPLLRFLRRCHEEFGRDASGALADYIPELAKADPNHFGICIATVDGYVHDMGDSLVPFTIQSISKAFVFALALETLGAARVEATVGVEPSGDAFNSIRLNATNRPFNPMINAGAIACSPSIASFMNSAVSRAGRSMSTRPSSNPSSRRVIETAPSPTCCAATGS